jgi:hypothetical protein
LREHRYRVPEHGEPAKASVVEGDDDALVIEGEIVVEIAKRLMVPTRLPTP